jgi:hypothetical protein
VYFDPPAQLLIVVALGILLFRSSEAVHVTQYDPFKPPTPRTKPREEIFVWPFVKDVRTFTGSLRAVNDERWEAVYLIDGALYKTQVFATPVLAEHDLIRTRDASLRWKSGGLARRPYDFGPTHALE